jgi:hypothetical protein
MLWHEVMEALPCHEIDEVALCGALLGSVEFDGMILG